MTSRTMIVAMMAVMGIAIAMAPPEMKMMIMIIPPLSTIPDGL